ncbi:hypothetical protein KFL_002630100 [Klebsormidium nitens]|uniref:glycerophosphodiester phosphodiesterase n=1 Tax=Klebsormidium nitens TaxID=105231 RepID=A0A1Y1IB87_KLENI|nr:hypothetical protein KFL_002630100 [Klebsormidium nitens]|eukprot:GAQ85966.1 hypothetical protein KFL_002630100 [Klebsormidium nitens]
MGKRGPSPGTIRWEHGIWRAILLLGACLFFGLIFIRRTLSHSEKDTFQKIHDGPSSPLPDGGFLTEQVLGRSESVELPVSKGASVTVSGGTCQLGLELGSIACCGHRGARIMAPENTLAAFRAAIELGANCLEMDVHMTADDGLVVMHERTMREKYYSSAKLPVAKKGVKRALTGWDSGGRWGAQSQRRHPTAQRSGRDLASLAGGPREDVHSISLSRTITIDRTTDDNLQRKGRKLVEADVQPRVEDMCLSEIKELDAGGWFGPEFASTPVPSLGGVLEFLWKEELQMVVELKAEARCDTTTDEGSSNEDYWDVGASSKAIHKAPSTVRCSSRQFEKRFVRSLMELLDSLEHPDHTGGRTQQRLRVLFASFNHRLIDQLTMELGRRQSGGTTAFVLGTAYILHPQEVYDGKNFLKEVKWLANHWSKTDLVMDTNAMHTGRQVVAWVADDLPELRHQVNLGVSGVITNDPSLCRQLCS